MIQNVSFLPCLDNLSFFGVSVQEMTICCFFSDSVVHKTASPAVTGQGFSFSVTAEPTKLSFQPIRVNYFFWEDYICSCSLMVKSFGSREFYAYEYFLGCCYSNAFKLRTTVTVHILSYVSYMNLIET